MNYNEKGRERMASKGKVLLMDDEQVILDVTNEVLGFLGYEVMFARDGDAALRLYAEEQAKGSPFDLVILDLSVPEGMGGKETFEKLKALDPAAKVVISSGFTNDPMLTDYSAFGLSGVLAKPYRITEIKALLENSIPKKW
jgi:CheY-like chemotaxis protein